MAKEPREGVTQSGEDIMQNMGTRIQEQLGAVTMNQKRIRTLKNHSTSQAKLKRY